MLGCAIAAVVAAVAPLAAPFPQDTGTIDAPVYEDSSFGVSIPRPFDDWVFEPGVGRGTATVIFHPRALPLSGQLWGALALTSFTDQIPLAAVADQRLDGGWRRELGRSFALRARDSVTIDGFPAIYIMVSGTVGAIPVEAEEYLIARDRDLVLLQFRSPRGPGRDSIAAGYRRMLAGLRLRGPGPRAPPAAPAPAYGDSLPTARIIPSSPWQVLSYDALVRYDSANLRLVVAARIEMLNGGNVPTDSVTVWLWPAFLLDSVRSTLEVLPFGVIGSKSKVQLPVIVPPREHASITYYYHVMAGATLGPLPPSGIGLTPRGAFVALDWLPRVQPAVDSDGQPVRTTRPRYSVRFDLPAAWRAVTPGRLTSDVTGEFGRQQAWTSGRVAVALPAFVLGPYDSVGGGRRGVSVNVWRMASDSAPALAVDSLVESIASLWTFCTRAFGPLPIPTVNVVLGDFGQTRGFAGLVLVARTAGFALDAAERDTLWRELARSWWGNSLAVAGPGSAWLEEALPAWTAVAAEGVLVGDSLRQRRLARAEAEWRADVGDGLDPPLGVIGVRDSAAALFRTKGVAALESARRAAGEPLFREAMLSIALNHRGGWLTLADVLTALGPNGAGRLRAFLY
jgi:hypothetical protein